MNEKNLTIFQRLSIMMQPNQGIGTQRKRFVKDEKQVLKTASKEEYQKEKLEHQQNQYLKNTWERLESDVYRMSTYTTPTRIAAYYDFDAMEFYPEIAAAMDLVAEEACTPNEQGKTLSIFSESERVKNVLEDLFYKVLDIETNLMAWTRNTAKYGENFTYLHVDNEKGILGVSQLPNIEIERLEGDAFMEKGIYQNDKEVKFRWTNKNAEFKSWQIAHFRILSDDRKLPYGTSLFEKSRRIWKQCSLSEDAMLIYRVTRAAERRVFKVFVGNMEDEAIESYIQKIANKFKRTQLVDPQTGQIDLRYNQAAVDQDWFIPVRSEGNVSVIDTLPGASNLGDIADIQFLQNKLFASLRIPKAFMGFEEAAGDGKNLALQDIRFARTINRIQKSMIQELNKIAVIHLYILGFEEELSNFTLGLSNPSTQADLLKIEQWQQKVDLYTKAVTDPGNGFQPMSMTMAKKRIFNMSDDEIHLDLMQQRLEKAVAGELEKTAELIPHTGFFDKIDRIYATKKETGEGGETPEEGGEEEPFGGGGETPGGGIPDFTQPNSEGGETPEEGGEEEPKEVELPPRESFKYGKEKLITEKLIKKNISLEEDLLREIDKLIKD